MDLNTLKEILLIIGKPNWNKITIIEIDEDSGILKIVDPIDIIKKEPTSN